jgi:hypothetical protein
MGIRIGQSAARGLATLALVASAAGPALAEEICRSGQPGQYVNQRFADTCVTYIAPDFEYEDVISQKKR